MPLLPLFPLGLVLFPGGTLPLHIFEPRYKQMIGECIEQERQFGVLLIRSGEEVGDEAIPHEVGTTARIARVQQLPDGTINIAAVGIERFRVLSLDHSMPYLSGEVSFIPRELEGDPGSDTVAERVRELFSEYYRLKLALGDQWSRRIGLPSLPGILANFVGNRLDIPPPMKQQLLELESVRQCLETQAGILDGGVDALAKQVRAAQRRKYSDFGMTN